MSPHLRALYYFTKPFLPEYLRVRIRQIHAREVRRKHSGAWPIDERAGVQPADWPGWPDGKKFAFVLTHDVESAEGLGKVRQLAELEMEYGFRSSFNFVPEGSYRVPRELREWLIENGFEIGVHDLNHDGFLYGCEKRFRGKAARINHYLREWGAVGFRSAFMLRQLDWLHELDIDYDASTFDTDPYEPQPDGCGSIFPFWVPHPADAHQGGYVELPYTLPQDSTLFTVLGERTAGVWVSKLSWLAGQGGLALVNIHPDYIDFETPRSPLRSYPARMLLELFSDLRERYDGSYWHPLPGELSRWFRAKCGV